MVREPWATRGIHWQEQWAATPKGDANPLNLVVVRIEGCNLPASVILRMLAGVQITLVKMEWLVIACHYHAVNVSPLLAHTARQVTQMFFR